MKCGEGPWSRLVGACRKFLLNFKFQDAVTGKSGKVLLLTAKTSRCQPPKPPTQRALADPPAGARFIAPPCCPESSALKFCSSPPAAYWRSASPIFSNPRPTGACRTKAGGPGTCSSRTQLHAPPPPPPP